MPTYEYRCRGCGHEFERFQKITAKPIKECPACGDGEAERLISSGAGVVFRGPGFYATDYRKSAPGERNAEEGGEKKSAEKGEKGEKGSGAKGEGKAGTDGPKED